MLAEGRRSGAAGNTFKDRVFMDAFTEHADRGGGGGGGGFDQTCSLVDQNQQLALRPARGDGERGAQAGPAPSPPCMTASRKAGRSSEWQRESDSLCSLALIVTLASAGGGAAAEPNGLSHPHGGCSVDDARDLTCVSVHACVCAPACLTVLQRARLAGQGMRHSISR